MRHTFRLSRRLLAITSASVLAVAIAATLAAGASARAAHHHGHDGGSNKGQHGNHGGGSVTIDNGDSSFDNVVGMPGVKLYTLSNHNGMTVKITNYGGVVQSISVPDRRGHVTNVALGFADLAHYVKMFTNAPAGGSGNAYFGAIIGRYANRIAGATFKLDQNGTLVTYGLGLPSAIQPPDHPPCSTTPYPNNGVNLLHGGPNSYNTQVWGASTSFTSNSASLVLKYTDPNCYNGFPSSVDNTVTYTLTSDNALRIDYDAKNTGLLNTVINLTNHTYFNLAGEGSGDVYNQLMQINADSFTPTNADLIPTGIAPVAGTPFDFRHAKPIGQDIRDGSEVPNTPGNQLVLAHGYDHNWVLNGGVTATPKFASFSMDPGSGRELWTYTTEPGVQFYTGNFLVGDLGRYEWPHVSSERWVHAGDPALPGLAQPAELPVDDARCRQDVHVADDLQVRGHRSRLRQVQSPSSPLAGSPSPCFRGEGRARSCGEAGSRVAIAARLPSSSCFRARTRSRDDRRGASSTSSRRSSCCSSGSGSVDIRAGCRRRCARHSWTTPTANSSIRRSISYSATTTGRSTASS